MNFSNIPQKIPQTFVAANAMEQNNKQSDFYEEYEQLIDDLNSDETVHKIEPTNTELLNEINKTKTQVEQFKNSNEFERLSKKLTHLIQNLIIQIQQNNCKKTKASLLKLFEHVQSPIFDIQLKLLKKELNK